MNKGNWERNIDIDFRLKSKNILKLHKYNILEMEKIYELKIKKDEKF